LPGAAAKRFKIAEDAHREGFAVVVIEDDCRGIEVDGLRWQLRAKARID
jgi:hypothetical protein